MPQNILRKQIFAELDRIDRQILAYLQNNARLSNKELAARVGLAPSSCLTRVRRLERSGALRGYHADVDARALGVTLEALVTVRLEKHVRSEIAGFERHLSGLLEARSWYHLAGANDYLVHVAVRDAEHLREFVLQAFSTRAEVAHMETALIFSHHRNQGFGLSALGGATPFTDRG